MASSAVPPAARGSLSAPGLILRQLCVAFCRQWFGDEWREGITELAWRLATEQPDSVDIDGVDQGALAEARVAFAWWADRGEVWLDEVEDGLVELSIAHWVAARMPVVEPVSTFEDPNVQLAVATSDTRCARCGAEIFVGDTFGLVQVPDGPSGWCCRSCVTGAA